MRYSAASPDAEPSEAMWTALRYFAVTRLVVTTALLVIALLGTPGVWSSEPRLPGAERPGLLISLVIYCGLSLTYLMVLPRLRPHFHPQLVLHVLTDLLGLVVLSSVWEGLGTALAVLRLASVAAAAVVSTRRQSAGFAAVLALLLIGQALWQLLQGEADGLQLLQAGLEGAAGFAAALGVNFLALRLEGEARLAQRRGQDVQAQLAVTRLVIAQLQQGVMVLDADGAVRALNPAAGSLVGIPETVGSVAPAAIDSQDWRELSEAIRRWRALPRQDAGPHELVLAAGTASPRRVLVRLLQPPGDGGSLVILIEDLRQVEEQARQLKLASMGRLSASIAHEVRNPLAAIRHANGLLGEQLDDPGLRRLAGIVESNTLRIDRIIEDVLSISRRHPPASEPLDAQTVLPSVVADFVESVDADPARVTCEVADPAPLLFDENHLRQVLVNLLGNALRHASPGPGAVRVSWCRRTDHRLELSVEDDGPGVAQELVQHLFEPFLTTEAQGTGLGLYLARELCHSNGAVLRYEPPGPARKSRFLIEPRQTGASPP